MNLPRKHETSFKPRLKAQVMSNVIYFLTLTIRLENLHMLEEESLYDFYPKLYDITNESFALGEKIPESMPMRKIIRSLPNRFQFKITAIEESNNLDTMKVEELIGSSMLLK